MLILAVVCYYGMFVKPTKMHMDKVKARVNVLLSWRMYLLPGTESLNISHAHFWALAILPGTQRLSLLTPSLRCNSVAVVLVYTYTTVMITIASITVAKAGDILCRVSIWHPVFQLCCDH